MPGIVATATANGVLPYSLCTSFVETRYFPVLVSGPYPDGRDQRKYKANISRKSWALGKRLTWDEWTELRDFYIARKGGHQPFYFYPREADHDPTGASPTGRYLVRFQGSISESYGIARHDVQLSLIEVE